MSYYHKYLDGYTRGFIGFNTLGILFQSCWGSVAAMTVLQNGNSPRQMVQLFFVVILCMLFNGAVMAQLKPKAVFNLLLASIFINAFIILLNVFVI
ncbi:MAG TPA: hypothetical protein VEA37_07495 [Flavobacterium sp.]|nr:hypothetical protein [Flavobacterium sp.]